MSHSQPDDILVSCLCVTEDRHAFIPWLLWGFGRQSWERRELVIVDSSARPIEADGDGIRVLRAPHRTSVAEKRNRALAAARGDIVTWFDDDDWQHPDKLSLLAGALSDGRPYAGSSRSWFVNLETRHVAAYRAPGRQPIFNGAGFRTDIARRERFPTSVAKASDSRWMRAIGRRHHGSGTLIDTPTFFWLCHERNLSNPASRRRFNKALDAVIAEVGKTAWGDTSAALDELARRIATPAPPRKTPVAEARPVSKQPVTAVVKATVLDTPYLGTILPHMLRQARHDFVERLVVVDPHIRFSGKYQTRAATDRSALDRVLDDLLAKREIDRVLEVPDDAHTVAETNLRYFGRTSVPTHALTGGPVFPTLWALDQAATDHVAQFDADILFHTDGSSWVDEALRVLASDPDYWLMMTHAGPPAGPPGESLAGANRYRATWDPRHRTWRFRTASTRFFLADRRRFRGKLPVLGTTRGLRPLEQLISGALAANGGWRGDVGDGRSWHIHAHSHAAPFPEWAPALVGAVEAGRVPKEQIGAYDMMLNRACEREGWQRVLFPSKAAPASRGVARAPAALTVRTSTAPAPIHVVIPVRDRGTARLRAVLYALAWQDRSAASIVVVSHGSDGSFDAKLNRLCRDAGIGFEAIAKAADPWCKPAALNHGIRMCPDDVPFVMALDGDMIFAPNLLSVVADTLGTTPDPGAFALCRSRDLPRGALIPADAAALKARFANLARLGRLRGRLGCGGIQAAPRGFFEAVGGYDEDFKCWGEEDRDMLGRAERYGLIPVWLEERTSILHQWHPHALHSPDPRHRAAARAALERNRALRAERAELIVRGARMPHKVLGL